MNAVVGVWYEGLRRMTTPEYRAWQHMKDRCYNTKGKNYPYYGARGITVCKAWKDSYAQFLSDMGQRPGDEYTLERKNGARGYMPSNCCWATRQQQARNRAYASVRQWELAEKLSVSMATTTHYLWVYRRELSGRPTRYKLSETMKTTIKKHLERVPNGRTV